MTNFFRSGNCDFVKKDGFSENPEFAKTLNRDFIFPLTFYIPFMVSHCSLSFIEPGDIQYRAILNV